MKIDLEIVRTMLKKALGFNSFVASFIKDIQEDKSHPTAGITKDGLLLYNPEFVDQFVTCKEDLFSLIFHELLHPMFGHFIYNCGLIENIAADVIINAVISCVYYKNSAYGNFFKKTHQPCGLDGIMRPDSELSKSRYFKVYEQLYLNHQNQDSMTTGELIQTLKILTDTENLSSVLLVGSHSMNSDAHNLSREILAKIAEELKRMSMDITSHNPAYFKNLIGFLVEAFQTHLSIKKVLLQKFSTKRKIDKFKELFHDRRSCISPIPVNPSKRDLVLIASGFYPAYFHNKLNKPIEENKGLAIYLDVSGSVIDYLPKIIGILKNLRKEITKIFLFSNKVEETSFESLLKGRIKTTYGTDFNCVAKSILEKNIDKAVIITDGYACMALDLKNRLKELHLQTLAILFDRINTCPDFAQFGDVMRLEDVCN